MLNEVRNPPGIGRSLSMVHTLVVNVHVTAKCCDFCVLLPQTSGTWSALGEGKSQPSSNHPRVAASLTLFLLLGDHFRTKAPTLRIFQICVFSGHEAKVGCDSGGERFLGCNKRRFLFPVSTNIQDIHTAISCRELNSGFL